MLSLHGSRLCLTFLAGALLTVAVSGDAQPLTLQPVNGNYHLEGKGIAVEIRTDHDFPGIGSTRQRWMTYRDQEAYRNIALKGPLFPLNSLMLHGLIYAKLAKGLSSDPDNDFASEVQSYFASGTQLQEMYITPSLLAPDNWNTLAHAALWARRRSSILVDMHWIGGDPGKLEVYGRAAWSPQGWIITLRNPSNRPQSFSLDLEAAFELPTGARINPQAQDPLGKPGAAAVRLNLGRPSTLDLAPFEVRTFESAPGRQ